MTMINKKIKNSVLPFALVGTMALSGCNKQEEKMVQQEPITQEQTEQLTQAKTKVYAGFEPRDIKQETILADGSTIVNVYYDRKEYTVT